MWNWKKIQTLVPPSGTAEVDFAACLDAFPQLEKAKLTPQDPVYHAEGDVWTLSNFKKILSTPIDAKPKNPVQLEKIETLSFFLNDVSIIH